MDGEVSVEEPDDSIGRETIVVLWGIDSEIVSFDVEALCEWNGMFAIRRIAFLVRESDVFVEVIRYVLENHKNRIKNHH